MLLTCKSFQPEVPQYRQLALLMPMPMPHFLPVQLFRAACAVMAAVPLATSFRSSMQKADKSFKQHWHWLMSEAVS
ncbi:MAG: hypothetical protein AUK53_04665 [Betaproteobacteria bacterium CG2_30_59_46]|nr:MAG: hypothetical protein AUK53_04665 [Betaproteobacteria bacterium CG2_30_59_46]PIQ13831.1 MAG: hypothetical protein COW70_02565 [Hydrogenophilales bacterium CG18_big_fil_WC_8_21_14_2_50_58_12]PIX98580.1 MAG: hypothetical protein COZ23_13665 [Hydrogenophilales bacterium CG_4_10_14_3_um_filter_58_23]PJB05786.1 MAG: hypothetical protein CO125_08395 [Hydrogenophilales bacterium CG_4_9_14_3_um_filter_59_35]